MHRLFVALRPPEPIIDLLIDAMDDSPEFRWQDEDQLHLTLRFIGEVDRPVANDLAGALQAIRAPALELRIHGIGRFEHPQAFRHHFLADAVAGNRGNLETLLHRRLRNRGCAVEVCDSPARRCRRRTCIHGVSP